MLLAPSRASSRDLYRCCAARTLKFRVTTIPLPHSLGHDRHGVPPNGFYQTCPPLHAPCSVFSYRTIPLTQSRNHFRFLNMQRSPFPAWWTISPRPLYARFLANKLWRKFDAAVSIRLNTAPKVVNAHVCLFTCHKRPRILPGAVELDAHLGETFPRHYAHVTLTLGTHARHLLSESEYQFRGTNVL
jgi:hypothetical protein